MRAAGILAFCLFSSILSTVASLKCHKCVVLGDKCGSADTVVQDCGEEEVFCSTTAVRTNITKSPVNLIIKGCSTSNHCLVGHFTTTTADGRFEVFRANCCQTDLCNEEPLPLENHDELPPNGYQCPGCYALGQNGCEPSETVTCVGDENQCLTISAIAHSFGNHTEQTSYQGCTTANTCSYSVGWSEIAGGQIQFNTTTLECSNATFSDPHLQG